MATMQSVVTGQAPITNSGAEDYLRRKTNKNTEDNSHSVLIRLPETVFKFSDRVTYRNTVAVYLISGTSVDVGHAWVFVCTEAEQARTSRG